MTNDLVCCRVGGDLYALTHDDVRSVARADAVRLERGADGRVGTLAFAGAAVPVYRLSARLGCGDHAASADRHVVITRGDGEPFGLLVDHINRTRVAEDERIQPLPSIVGALASSRFAGLVPLGDVLCLVLSPSAIDPIGPRAYTPSDRAAADAAATAAVRSAAADLALIFSTDAIPRRERTRYALNAKRVVALVQALPSIAVPGAAPFVAAVGWWRRSVVPILDFRRADARAAAAGSTRYLIARCGAPLGRALVAFATGADLTLHRATADDRLITEGIFGIGREPVALLDLDRLVAEAESPHGSGARRI
ncbi:MAG TPA: chemotaxis protein CheW [Vicinamibacterales bacterium]|nr:chemotaxis protein CheW [Vicinamibacterales bacterium]